MLNILTLLANGVTCLMTLILIAVGVISTCYAGHHMFVILWVTSYGIMVVLTSITIKPG